MNKGNIPREAQMLIDKLSKLPPLERWEYFYSHIYSRINETAEKARQSGKDRSEALEIAAKEAANIWGCSVKDIEYPEGLFMPKKVYEDLFKDYHIEHFDMVNYNAAKHLFEAEREKIESKLSEIKRRRGSKQISLEYLSDVLEEMRENYGKQKSYSDKGYKTIHWTCFDKYLKPYLDDKINEIKNSNQEPSHLDEKSLAEKHLSFMKGESERNHRPIFDNDEEFKRLIRHTDNYFENLEVPNDITPVKPNVQNYKIYSAYKQMFCEKYPNGRYPKSLFVFLASVFPKLPGINNEDYTKSTLYKGFTKTY